MKTRIKFSVVKRIWLSYCRALCFEEHEESNETVLSSSITGRHKSLKYVFS